MGFKGEHINGTVLIIKIGLYFVLFVTTEITLTQQLAVVVDEN